MQWFDEEFFQLSGQPFHKQIERSRFVNVVLISLIAILTFNLAKLTLFEHSYWQRNASSHAFLSLLTIPPRGIIFDRHLKPLATNQPNFDLFIDFQSLTQEKQKAVKDLIESHQLETQKVYENSLLVKNIPREEALRLLARYPNDLTFRIIDSFERVYPEGPAFGNLLGYLGFPTETEIATFGFQPEEFIGKTGLEKVYQHYLRQSYGELVFERDAKNQVQRLVKKIEARPGFNLVTTIDAEFQRRSYELMRDYLSRIGVRRGVLVALDPNTGEILALISYPSFDNQIFVNNRKNLMQVLNDADRPLFNRAIAGLYAPGSTIKPILAAAALEEKIISPEKQIYSSGELRIPNPYFPGRFSVFKDWRAHGWVDMRSAIANSVNVYFYTIGGGYGDQPGLGINLLNKYFGLFGLGQITGVDFIGEEKGFLPTPETKKKNLLDPVWRLGDTYNVSIGQGDLLVTPLQISMFTSALATNKLYQPFLVKQIKSADMETVIYERQPKIIKENLVNPANLKIVQEGMRMTVTQGTAKSLGDLDIEVAGKSGTPQVFGKNKLNAIFTGYAPYNQPEIVLTLLFENVPSGSGITLPLYRDIVKLYFELKKQNKSLETSI
jgi:penicillin-binding protein 2